MPGTNKISKLHLSSNKTKKLGHNKGKGGVFAQTMVVMFMEMLMMVKLYHWKTYGYAQHKATDDFYGSLNDHVDEFIEVLMGKVGGERINLLKHKKINLIDLPSTDVKAFTKHLNKFKAELESLDSHPFIASMSSNDLLNIRDEIIGDLNKLAYLLTLD